MASNCGGSGWVEQAAFTVGTDGATEMPMHARCPGCAHEECPNRPHLAGPEHEVLPEILRQYRNAIDCARQEERDLVKPILEAVATPVWGLDNADWVPGVVRPHLKKLNDIQAAVAAYRKQVEATSPADRT